MARWEQEREIAKSITTILVMNLLMSYEGDAIDSPKVVQIKKLTTPAEVWDWMRKQKGDFDLEDAVNMFMGSIQDCMSEPEIWPDSSAGFDWS